MDDKKYNGYTNYETWGVCLWIDNDQNLQDCAREIVQHKNLDDGSAAQALKEWMTAAMPDLGPTIWADLLAGAMSEVNWQEVAEQYEKEEE